jgi:hypothetical protein
VSDAFPFRESKNCTCANHPLRTMGDGELQADEAPDDIVFADQVMSVAFHPEKNIVAASTVRPLLLFILSLSLLHLLDLHKQEHKGPWQ